MSQPHLSVLLPVYNDDEFLEEAIRSILNQTYDDFELIALDDGSTDQSHSILQEFALKDSRIRVFSHPNMGLGSTLNTGIERVRGELLARHDADDRSHPQRFSKQVEFLATNPSVSLVGTATTVIDDSGNAKYRNSVATGNDDLRRRLRSSSPFAHGSVMMRRNHVVEAGGYPSIIWLEDLVLWRAISQLGEIDNIDLPLYEYRVSPGNLYVPRKLQKQVTQLFQDRWPDDNFTDSDLDLLESIRKKITARTRKSQFHLNLAKGLLLNTHAKMEARKNLLQALGTNPLVGEVWFQLALSMFPQSIAKGWRNRRVK